MLEVAVFALAVGVVTGFFLNITVGPVGLIVFQRSMVKSRLLGLVTGVGAALADGFLASIGAFSIGFIWNFINEYHLYFRLVGGIIIFIFGLAMVFSKEKAQIKRPDNAITILEHFFSGILLSLTNPFATFTFVFLYTYISHKVGRGVDAATMLVSGVVIGSMLWWITLSHIAKTVGHKIKPEHIGIVNKCFGLAVAIIGAVMILGGLF